MAAELQSMNEQLSDGGRSNVEVEKLQRKLGLENEELQLALEEAEGALEQEEAKLLKLQLEYTQLKQSSDRKLADKEDELDTSRKNHQRQLEALQATIDAELRTYVFRSWRNQELIILIIWVLGQQNLISRRHR